jgi:hypothetical protein
MTDIVIWIHLAATLFLTGLIWVIQIVHYPLLDQGGVDGFAGFHRRHTRRISLVVIPPMLVELATACWLALENPEAVPVALPRIGLVLLGIVWLSTFALQVPEHNRLSRGFDRAAHRRLVTGNWIRTIAWSLRAAVALAIALAAKG